MNIAYVAPILLVLLPIAFLAFRSRAKTRPVADEVSCAPVPEEVVESGAIADADPLATLQIHHAALKAPEPRKGGIDVRERQPRLIGISKEVRGLVFPLEPTGAIIGRAPENSIRVSDPRVSQRQAWVGVVHDKAMVCDLNSTNGTFINAASDAPITEAELRPNDTVMLGGHGGMQFRFVVERDDASH